MADVTNPLISAMRLLWTILEQCTAFTSLVGEDNRIKYIDGKRSPEIAGTLGPNDSPRVRIRPVGGFANLQCTTSTSDLVKLYAIEVLSVDKQGDEALGVEWAIVRAFAKWFSHAGSLTWGSLAFVNDVSLRGLKHSIGPTDEEPDVPGWVAVCQVEVGMTFTTSSLEVT